MSNGEPGNDRLGRNQRREDARDKAKAMRDQHRKKERRNRLFLQGGIGVGILVILAIVAIVVTSSIKPAVSGPLNMQSDGITIGKGFDAVRTPAIPANGLPIATTRDKKSSVVTIRIYLDYFCPVCNSFETGNKTQISSWLKSGAATLEIHPIAILDHSSQGSRYASRAANAGACVANYAPDDYWTFTQAMYAKQPKEDTAGLLNPQLVSVIRNAGVHDMTKIASCVNTEKFAGWVTAATDRAVSGPLPDSNVKTAASTPTVIVDGLFYNAPNGDWGNAANFNAFVVQAAGATFDAGSSSTPSPTPSPTPTK